MEFKKYNLDDVVSHHSRNAKEVMPQGAVKYKTSKAGRWRKPRPRRDQGVSFNLTGPCSGELSEVMSLGIKLAKEETAKGNIDLAQRILNRTKKIPMEYRRAELEAQLTRLYNLKSSLTK